MDRRVVKSRYGPAAAANASYSAYDGSRLVDPFSGERANALANFVHDGLRSLVLSDHFTCVGGKSAIRHNAYRFGLYSELGAAESVAGLARDLSMFIGELPSFGDSLTTYLASFGDPASADEATFEARLWATLQGLHDLDAPHHAWAPGVSDDPADPHFSFSFGGVAFFVIGLHAASSRVTRRFAWPTLVFNPHRQFEQLRQTGEFERFQQIIRRGEEALQGNVNPMLANHGERSEAAQYSGRLVSSSWRCPFHAAADDEPKD